MSGRRCYLCDGLVGGRGTRMWVETGRGGFASVGMRGNLRVGGGNWQGLRTVCDACAAERTEQDQRAGQWAFFAILVVASVVAVAAGYLWPTVACWGFVLLLMWWDGGHGGRWRVAHEKQAAEREYAATIARLRNI